MRSIPLTIRYLHDQITSNDLQALESSSLINFHIHNNSKVSLILMFFFLLLTCSILVRDTRNFPATEGQVITFSVCQLDINLHNPGKRESRMKNGRA